MGHACVQGINFLMSMELALKVRGFLSLIRSSGHYWLLFYSSYERKGCTLPSKCWSQNGEVHNMP